ncbi:type II secretion system F family protein [Thermodesulfobacteriota bacterium]
MAKFFYRAIDEDGNTVTGDMESESVDTVNAALIERGFVPSSVTRKAEEPSVPGWDLIKERFTRIRTADLIIFTKQFRTMARAGVPMLTILQVLQNQTENSALKKTVGILAQDIKEGYSLNEAFSKHPRVFSPLFCSMVKAGEASGALPEVMDRLTYIIEHENKIKSDIRSALQYPLIVITFLGVAFFVLLTFVVPKFISIFERAGISIPIPTRICIYLYEFLASYWVFLLGGTVLIFIIIVLYLRTEEGKFSRDRLFVQLPLVGQLVLKAAMSRFSSIFAILQSSGVSVLESLDILSGTIGNLAISREVDLVAAKLEEGRGIAEPLRTTKYFTPIVVNMVAIGEETGNLDQMLNDVSVHYDSELEYGMKRLSEAIGPMLTLGLAAVVGFFALSIFLPMWDITKMTR